MLAESRARTLNCYGTLAIALALGACTSGSGSRGRRAAGAHTSVTNAGTAIDATVDANLPLRSIRVDGDPVVGSELTVRMSADLAGTIQSWGWHRCSDPPTCETISFAIQPRYVLTKADAWHVLRVIAVAARTGESAGGIDTVTTMVVNPHPDHFVDRGEVTPSRGTGLAVYVAPGQTDIVIDADCPVIATAGVNTPTPEGTHAAGGATDDTESQHHELHVSSGGGLLTVGTSGSCDHARVAITGKR